jgi:LmbE family N-acetylglucosaminyl deacetylase
MNNVNLIVVAHPDDEILGFGATGAKLVAAGEIVQPIILCGNVDARLMRPSDQELFDDMTKANRLVGFSQPVLGSFPNIRMNTVAHIELVQFIEKQIINFNPTRIFTHHPGDANNDHLEVSKACVAASRLYQRRDDIMALGSLYFMEILSSTEWSYPGANQGGFQPTVFVEIDQFLQRKIAALECYRTVMRPFPHPRSKEVVTGLAALRGAQSRKCYAEAFQLAYRSEI